MLARQRRAVEALAAEAELARARTRRAEARTERVKSRFLTNPVNLLLPFVGGVLGGALALHRRPVSRRGARRPRPKIAWTSLATTATTLWNASLPLRLSLAESRAAARLHDEAVEPERPAPPERPVAPAPGVPPTRRPAGGTQPAPPA